MTLRDDNTTKLSTAPLVVDLGTRREEDTKRVDDQASEEGTQRGLLRLGIMPPGGNEQITPGPILVATRREGRGIPPRRRNDQRR